MDTTTGVRRVVGEYGITEYTPNPQYRPDAPDREAQRQAEQRREHIKYPDMLAEYFGGDVAAYETAKVLGFPGPVRNGFREWGGVFGVFGKWRDAVFSRSAIEHWMEMFRAVAQSVI